MRFSSRVTSHKFFFNPDGEEAFFAIDASSARMLTSILAANILAFCESPNNYKPSHILRKFFNWPDSEHHAVVAEQAEFLFSLAKVMTSEEYESTFRMLLLANCRDAIPLIRRALNGFQEFEESFFQNLSKDQIKKWSSLDGELALLSAQAT